MSILLYIIFKLRDIKYANFYEIYFNSNLWNKELFYKANYGARHDRISIHEQDFFTIKIPITNIIEQDYIGDYLKNIYLLIQKKQKKLDKIKQLKQTLHKKMFPSGDSNIPEIRFKGFTNTWEKKKFKDIFYFIKNNNYSRNCLIYNCGLVKNIHYGDILTIFNYHINYCCNKIPYINKNINIVGDFLSDGDIIFVDTAEDDTVGKCIELYNVKGYIVAGLHTYPCRANIKFEKYYLAYLLNSDYFHSQLIPLIQGTKVCSLSKSAFYTTKIVIPCTDEQAKIGNYFYKLDKLINLYEKEIEKLENLKKAFLKKMFV